MTTEVEYQNRLKKALLAMQKMRARVEALENARQEPIAIIGLNCRFPGARDPEAFWELLHNGVDAITEVPENRWPIDDYFDTDPEAPGKMSVRWGGFLDDVDKFDATFFGVSPREARSMDPQQRLLLETSWAALEHAGIAPTAVTGSNTGVFMGVTVNDYLQRQAGQDPGQIDAYRITGNSLNSNAGRLSYFLGAHGPSLIVDTACSSSLTAVHLAVNSLRSGESEMALVGGVNLILSPEMTISATKANMMAADGRCKTFDARADGFIRSEGVGVVVLKRFADAQRDGDRVLALIRGTAVNQDGPSSGLTVPNKLAQEAVIRAALQNAGVDPTQINYVEAHGTGTSLGDPIEVRALAAALGEGRERPFYLGSVKTNIGHAESAAGIAGLIKLVLALQHEEIPPHLHFETPTPHIDWDAVPAIVPTQPTPWTGPERFAGLSAFGASGTNAHAIVSAAPVPETEEGVSTRPYHLLPLSAQTEPALRDLAGRYVTFLDQTEANPADICGTAATGRSHFKQRLVVTGATIATLREKLAQFAAGQEAADLITGAHFRPDRPRIAFLYTGHGSQYVNMGRELYEGELVFRDAVLECEELLQPYLNVPMTAVLYPTPDEEEEVAPLWEGMTYTQPAQFVLAYALTKLWASWGITPDGTTGHSVGEYAAACAAGIISVEDGLKLVAARGRLMDASPQGAMAAVFAEEAVVAEAIAPYADQVSLAVINGPTSLVISGVEETVTAICADLKAQKIKTRRLNVAQSSHSPLVEWFLDEFETIARSVTYTQPQAQYISCVTGQPAAFDTVGSAAYWRTHQRQPVRFAAAATTLLAEGYEILVEIGPAPTLLGIIKRLPNADENTYTTIPSLRKGNSDQAQMLAALGELYVNGVDVPWDKVERPQQRIHLPTYPFQQQRYWLDTDQQQGRRTPPLHPLLGWRVRAASKDTIFERDVSTKTFPFLADHRVYGTAVFPATAYIEMALAAGTAVNHQRPALADLLLHEPFVLPAEASRWLQLVLAKDGGVQLLSQAEDETWTLHATGRLEKAPAAADATPLAELQARLTQEVSVDEQYADLQRRGLAYGPAFRGLVRLWRSENENGNEALAEITRPESVPASGYNAHPALLDAALHPVSVLLMEDELAYMPFSIGTVQLHDRLPHRVWSHITISESGAETVTGIVHLYDEAGTLVGTITDLVLKQVTETAVFGVNYDDWLYEVHWQETDLDADFPVEADAEAHCLIFADSDGIGEKLAAALADRGQQSTLIWPGDAFAAKGGNFHVNPTNAEDFRQLLAQVESAAGIIYLWSLIDASGDLSSASKLADTQKQIVGGALHLVQALAAAKRAPRLWLVTQAAQPVGPIPPAMAQSPLWGLGKVVAQEHPELRCTRLDLDPAVPDVDALVSELLAKTNEDQVALRSNGRFLPRLVRHQPLSAEAPLKAKPFQLATSQPGVLENLEFRSLDRRPPSAGEVEIQVVAAGLGFRDVLNALGMYPGGPIPFGGECAGIVTAVGEGVTHVQEGDAVLAMAIGSFQTYAYAPAEFVTPKPNHLSFENAATIPSAFLTAYYGLIRLAQLQAGEKVLIHAAAGGVGMAAVQLAQHVGAEVYGTAGSPQKRALLRALGVRHVFDSRSTAFAAEIEDAAGKVDVVLNSLAGEFVEKSVSVLAENGRFIEIGKRDIWTPAQFAAARPHAAYHVMDLAAEGQANPALIQTMFREVIDLFNSGALRPLPTHIFAMSQAEDAFRFMAQAKHTGKIVLSLSGTPRGINVTPVGTHLITGGLGGLGLAVARWLVTEGARHLVLVGRSQPSESAQAVLDELEAAGAQVHVMAADVTNPDEIEQLFAHVTSELPPLRGVIHAAGTLDDGVLGQQTWDRFAQVLAPKVQGGWILHRLTANLPLDYFVLFSSAVSLLGSAGQANHVAASTFLDALAHYRRAHGLPALSIDWGPWSQVGAAAADDISERIQTRGINAMSPDQGIDALKQVMAARDTLTQVGVIPVDWSIFLAQTNSPFFVEMARAAEADGAAADVVVAPAWFQQIQEAPPSKRAGLLLSFVREQSLKVLGLASDFPLNQHQPLQELGLDSLMAVELRNLLGRGLGLERPLPATLVFDYPTSADLAQYLAQFFAESEPEADKAAATETDLNELEALSDDDAEALLLAELEMLRKEK